MTPQEYEHLTELFHAALEIAPDQRAAFLDQVTDGNADLRRELESLLAAHEQRTVYTPPADMAAGLNLAQQDRGAAGGGAWKGALAPNTRIDRYEIRSLLGKGGMGEVYLAEDTKLGRKVALKILPTDVVADHTRMRRFIQEAKAASALNHPNILTIYETGQTDSTHFIATEYIEGETLRHHLSGLLPLNEVLDICVQVAVALAAAHQAGIIHRDIKPENIMLRGDGIVKVLDFGLAKLSQVADKGSADRVGATTVVQTEPGVVFGTIVYMSPEQARGMAVDARTDIFSLGVVLYEMVAGCLPFTGSTSSEVLAAILSEKVPQPLARYSREAPDELERIVSKALRKNRDERFQTIRDLLIDLKDLQRELLLEAQLVRRASSELPARGTTEGNEPAPTVPTQAAQTVANTTARRVPNRKTLLGESKRLRLVIGLTIAVLALAAVASFFYFHRQPALTDKDTILLTDWVNTTGDTVFDGTLKQALAVHLGQSPFLNIFSDDQVRETLRLMNRTPEERVTKVIGREICQRQGLKAMLSGSVASFGRDYVITLEAVNGQTGDVLAREQVEAEGKEQVLRSLGEAATRLREKLGESLSSIQKFDAPLEQVTTSSLEALKAYSLSAEQKSKAKSLEAISSLKHAIELDPNFALAYSDLAETYGNTRQPVLAAGAAQKAFELRERVSEREKFHIASRYYSFVTGEIDKTIEALELCTQTYPRDETARHNLGFQWALLGQYEKAVEEYREVLRLDSRRGRTCSNLSGVFVRLNRFEEAKAMGEQAIALQFDYAALREYFYNIAFIQGDTAAMKEQIDWASGRPGEYDHLNWQAGAAAFAGQWLKAREFSNRAVELAEQSKLQEDAGSMVSSNAEWAAVLGQCQQSSADLARAAAFPRTQLSFFRAGMSLALCGEAAQAQTLNDEAVKRYPKDTRVNQIYLPLVRAELELQRGNRTQAIQMLQAASRHERVSFYYQDYLRGQAYLGEKKGAEAVSEFQTILDHRGWDPLSPLYPLAHLGLARAAALQGNMAKSRKAYQDFFALWKDADPDLPVLIEAKKEYEKVK